jgi:hypothetical protein
VQGGRVFFPSHVVYFSYRERKVSDLMMPRGLKADGKRERETVVVYERGVRSKSPNGTVRDNSRAEPGGCWVHGLTDRAAGERKICWAAVAGFVGPEIVCVCVYEIVAD